MKNHLAPGNVFKAGLTRLTLLTLLAATAAGAETPAANTRDTPAELFRRVQALDHALFDAFNRCELEKLETYFIAELEFYHDNDGLASSRSKFIADVKNNVCGKFRRELVTESLEVWPLGDYGAVYAGTHRFCKFAASKCEGTGRFMHILRNIGGQWKITRVVSYDHKAAPPDHK